MTTGGQSAGAQLEMPGMPRRLFPVHLVRPAPPPKGPPWAEHTGRFGVAGGVGLWLELPMGRRTTGAARQLLYSSWSATGFRDAAQSELWRSRAAGWLTDYVAG